MYTKYTKEQLEEAYKQAQNYFVLKVGSLKEENATLKDAYEIGQAQAYFFFYSAFIAGGSETNLENASKLYDMNKNNKYFIGAINLYESTLRTKPEERIKENWSMDPGVTS